MAETSSLPLTTPVDGMVVRESTRLAPGIHSLPNGLRIAGDGITLDGAGATLIGERDRGAAVRVEGCSGVTVRGCSIQSYQHGIYASRCSGLTLAGNTIRGTSEVPANTVFLDIWKPAADAYGGAILLHEVADSLIEDNDIQHQMNGLLTYGCRRLTVRRNNASYNSGFGIHLYETCHSVIAENFADYCCRYEPRGLRAGHVGADAAGFVIVHRSCHNVFRRNFARLGGDGFFLAGLTQRLEKVGCDFNVFEQNDGSLSPNIAFEATFSMGNVFRDNRADYCNFGFWLGYSWDNTLADNRMVSNRTAGIAVEHGRGMTLRRNHFHGNAHGVLLWTKRVPELLAVFPEAELSRDWTIEENTFVRNGTGVRIAADQDHGIRPVEPATPEMLQLRPVDHRIRRNVFNDHRVAIELVRCDRTTLIDNTFTGSVEANLRETDCRETVARPNLGLAGAYIS
ncbi:MAG: right-handed parallel beta-helix repeat-containing protein [Phycisphaerae bacterium]|nr:right-handed parallel beta-helix repeat-containing protein [Phycisphaerae bacterium]NUQ44748.1 right-handed parallel beta-helix repeat-containing protein [Phycisphaerae bacterium]